MRYLAFLLLNLSAIALASSEEELCLDYVELDENYKLAHQNPHCLRAVELGSGPAMYSVGMGYGFAGDSGKELTYYRLAAEQGVAAAYLALGHALRESNEEEAVLWYELFARTDAEASFYAAGILAEIHEGRGNTMKAQYWRNLAEEKQRAAGY